MSTTTHTKTEPPVVVNPDVLLSVQEFIKANNAHIKTSTTLESRNWVLVEQALTLFEAGKTHEEVTAEFRAAFDKATAKSDPNSVAKTTYRLMTTKVANIAAQGREWVEERRKANRGFFSSYEVATENIKAAKQPKVTTPLPVEEIVKEIVGGKPTTSSKPSKSKKGSKGKPATEKIVVGGGDDRTTFDKALDILLKEPNLLLELIEELVKSGKVVYVDLIRNLIEQAHLPNDALESLVEVRA